jgi:hypothetical protein
VDLLSTRVRSGAVNPARKLTSIIAAMMRAQTGAQTASMTATCCVPAAPRRLFDECMRPLLGISLREFTFGHANQLAAVGRAHLVALGQRVALRPGFAERAFIDIDSPLRPVYGDHKRGAHSGTPGPPAARTAPGWGAR